MERNGLVIWFGLSILLPMCLLLPASAIEAASKDIRIGILEDGPHPGNEILIRTVKSELKKMSEGRFAISYPEEKQVNGEFRIDEIKKNAQALAADTSLDLIFALGTESAKALAGIRPLRIPVVAGNVEFPVEFGLLES
ncbi:MAG: hypothetical protein GY866_01310, partial [Proteobacteria bacterium]|nr:hypothetical protein [Pseudomonadota bacterium]